MRYFVAMKFQQEAEASENTKYKDGVNRNARLIVRNISFKATEDSLRDHFSQYGTVEEVKLLRKPDGKLVGCGFVHYTHVPMANKAITATNKKPFLDRPIYVSWAVPRHKYGENAEQDQPPRKSATFGDYEKITVKDEDQTKSDKDKNKQRINRNARLIIRNVSFKATEESLKEHFQPYGDILEVKLLKKPDGKLVGCAFVHFKNVPMAKKALLSTNMKPFLGRPISVDWAVAKDKYMQHIVNQQLEMQEDVKKEDSDSDEDEPPLNISNDDVKAEIKSESDGDSVKEEDDSSAESDDEDDKSDDEDSDDEKDGEEQEEEDDVDDDQSQTSTKPEWKRTQLNDAEDGCTVFVSNVPFSVDSAQLREFVEGTAPVRYALVCVDKLTEHSKGSGFIKFTNQEDADKFLALPASSLRLDGQTLQARPALRRDSLLKQPRQPKDNRNLYLVKEGGECTTIATGWTDAATGWTDAAGAAGAAPRQPAQAAAPAQGQPQPTLRLDGQTLQARPALRRDSLLKQPRQPKDNRNLYLVKEGEQPKDNRNLYLVKEGEQPKDNRNLYLVKEGEQPKDNRNLYLVKEGGECTTIATGRTDAAAGGTDAASAAATRTSSRRAVSACYSDWTDRRCGWTDRRCGWMDRRCRRDSLLKQPRQPKDNRNLYLVKEGVVAAGSRAALGVSGSDMAKRLALERSKTQMLKNLNRFVSRYRLVVSNLPPSWNDTRLRRVCVAAAGRTAVVTEARVMRDLRAPLGTDGQHPSKGYGFVMFTRHEDALTCLRKLNNNPDIIDQNNRPIVSFSIEDRTALNARKKRLEKSIANNPTANKPDNDNQSKNRKRKNMAPPDESYVKKGRFDKPKNHNDDFAKKRLMGKKHQNQNENSAGKFVRRPRNDESNEYTGLTAKEGSQHKMRSNHKLRQQADVHRQQVKMEKKKSKKAMRLKMAAKERVKQPKQKINKAPGKKNKRKKFKSNNIRDILK
ncbi:RNA-binding protein 28-like [Ostrinia nubilalis]|uniref:RNA-binding protein 28-like n=1 Tax=Ostrinia nubilalis TaxID=29057 RepID=UPI0030825218